MAKRIMSEKEKALRTTLKSLKKEKENLENKNSETFYKYVVMEGMYGKKVSSPWDCGQGMRGYHCEWDSIEIEKKEEAEREQFLKDNKYYENKNRIEEIEKEINELNKKICFEQYNMTLEEKMMRDEIKRTEKYLEEAKESVNFYEKALYIKKKKLEKYLGN